MLTTIMKKLFILYTLLFLLPLLQHNSGALHAQGSSGCYVSYKENLGLTEVVGLPELQAEACSLANVLPTTFQSQFKVYSVAYYLYTPLMGDGTPPALAQYVAEIAALSPYYLIIAKENTPNALVNKFSIVLKLPDTEGFSCLTENDRSFFQRQLEIEAKSEYSQRGNLPSNYPFAEKKVVEQLKKYITKSLDCCAGGNKMPCESCSPCPDIPAATAIEDYFTNVLFKGDLPNIVKLPIVIDDCFDPTDPTNSQTLSRVQTVKELPFKFREEDPGFGRIGAVVNSVLTSDYFEGVDPEKIKGFVTSNYVECSIADKEAFENIKNIFIPPPGGFAKSSTSYDYLVWCHIWQNPSSTTEGYLYIYGEIPGGRSPLENDGGLGEKVAEALEKSYLYEYEETAYNSRFEQNGTVVVFETVATCYDKEKDGLPIDHVPDYGPKDPTIYCNSQNETSVYYLSPAMNPVRLPAWSTPNFSATAGSTAYGFDWRALTTFTTPTEFWRGCFNTRTTSGTAKYKNFSGYYTVPVKGVYKYKPFPDGFTPETKYAVLISTLENSTGLRILEFMDYTPPSNRPVNNYADGPLVLNFFNPENGLSNYTGLMLDPEPYYIVHNVTGTLDEFRKSLANATYYPLHQGLVFKANGTYYKVNRKDLGNNIHVGEWSIFNCGTGKWERLSDNPFSTINPEYGELVLQLVMASGVIHTGLAVLGTIPVFGVVFDVVDGVIYFAEGDKTAAAISFTAAALPLIINAAVVTGKAGVRLVKEGVVTRLGELYPNATTAEIATISNKLADETTEVNSVLINTTCVLGGNKNGGEESGMSQGRCQVLVRFKAMQKRAEALGDVKPEDWGAYVSEILHKGFGSPATKDVDFIRAAAKADELQLGPDLFHAWNTSRKAGATLDLQQLTKLGEDITNTPGLAKAFGENPELVKGWEGLLTSPVFIRRNVDILQKSYELLAAGFTKLDLEKLSATLSKLLDRSVPEAELSKLAEYALQARKFTNSYSNYGIDVDLFKQLDVLSDSPKFLNPENIGDYMKLLNNSIPDNPGHLEQLNEGIRQLSIGDDIYIESKVFQGDIVNKTKAESIQYKAFTGSGPDATTNNLKKAAEQFNTEVPPSGYKKIAKLKILETSNPQFSNSTEQLRVKLQSYVDTNASNAVGDNLRALSEIVIENTAGLHRFKVVNTLVVILP